MSHRILLSIGTALLGLSAWVVLPAAAQKGGTIVNSDTASATFNCPTGPDITNGVELLLVDIRPGDYKVTAIGVDGFDPILGIEAEGGSSACSDDTTDARNYELDLPTTGRVDNSNFNAQLNLNNNGAAFVDFRIVVGGYQDGPGEFVLLVEGLAVTAADNAGDPFSLQITQNIIDSGVPVTAYLISVVNTLDPYMSLVDVDYNVIDGTNGDPIICDDGGNAQRCFGVSEDLGNSSITTANRTTPGGSFDAMIALDLSNMDAGGYLNYLMSSYNQQTRGDYLAAFHIGISDGTGPADT